ncbi:hypothetical protein BpHYR1_037913 [Brachionus plicatilis]|uniref:RNA-directed DNA polymerase from mobile element jockey-like n=1 Tax=Brachionus plicatilis TaxID=10195 RepID=A0A3M7PWP3_BRAPC|nr:hypothetical protein BpHYR1_037913 [Brachionus plicatilis]
MADATLEVAQCPSVGSINLYLYHLISSNYLEFHEVSELASYRCQGRNYFISSDQRNAQDKFHHFLKTSDYYEILDIFLIPSSLSDRVVDFKVLIDHDMLSDHFPIQAIVNKLTSELRHSLKEFWNQNWLEFINKTEKNPLSSRPFWRKINKLGSKKSTRQIPSLFKDGKEFNTDIDKGKIFGDLLAATFSPHLDFNESEDNCEISHENWQGVV